MAALIVALVGSCVAISVTVDDGNYTGSEELASKVSNVPNDEEPAQQAESVDFGEYVAPQSSVVELVRSGNPRACAEPETKHALQEMLVESVEPRKQRAEAIFSNLQFDASLITVKGINRDTNEIQCQARVALQIEGFAPRQFPLLYILSPALDNNDVVVHIDGLSLLGPQSYLKQAVELSALSQFFEQAANTTEVAQQPSGE